jgi:uncharacterized protein with PQ loop repeat
MTNSGSLTLKKEIDLEKILGILAVTSSFYAILIGLTSQVWKNYKRKSVDGFSPHFFFSVYVLYVLWMSYGLAKPGIDYYLVVPNMFAVLIGAVFIYQFVAYRKKK